MVQLIIKTALCLCLSVSLASCLKLQVNAEGVVEDTVSAGKSLYKTIKHKKDGTEERLYTHMIDLLPDADEQRAGSECLAYLTKTINAASDKAPKFLEQNTEVIKLDAGDKMKCSILALV